MGAGYDRNAQKGQTRSRLIMAFLALTERGGGRKVTVRQICDAAGVHRSTFYAHFRDVYDIVDYVTDYLRDELRDELVQRRDAGTLTAEAAVSIAVAHTCAHQYFYRLTMASGLSFSVDKMHSAGYELFLDLLIAPRCRAAGIGDPSEIAYYAAHFFNGLSGVMRRWLEGGCREGPGQIEHILCSCLPSWLPDPKGTETDQQAPAVPNGAALCP